MDHRLDNGSGVSREVHAPFYERLAGKFRWSTLLVICCQYQSDAERVKEALNKPLAKFSLALNQEKTRLVQFSKAKARQNIKQEAFDFLGFTFYLGKSQRGILIPKVKTNGTRLRKKLKKGKRSTNHIFFWILCYAKLCP